VLRRVRIHAVRVCLQLPLQVARGDRPGSVGSAPEAQRACLHVGGQGGLAEQFGERAVGGPAGHVHLEEPITGMHPAIEEHQLMHRPGPDVRDAQTVPGEHRLSGACRGARRRLRRAGDNGTRAD
jgi:hypothetical protein